MTAAPVQPPLSASGRYIVDAHGRRVRLAGVNWYGAHEDDGVASGLDRTDRVGLGPERSPGSGSTACDSRSACG